MCVMPPVIGVLGCGDGGRIGCGYIKYTLSTINCAVIIGDRDAMLAAFPLVKR